MTFSSIFAQFVAILGGMALQWRKMTGTEPAPAWGEKPAIPGAKPQGAIPTLKMPTARGSANRDRLIAKTGVQFQVPYLVDPNTGVALFESSEIVEYLEEVYTV